MPMISIFHRKKRLIDSCSPQPPFYLTAENLFVQNNGREVFLKLISSFATDIKQRGAVILAPGIATNANIFRIDDDGKCLRLNHNRSFANLLAAEGFKVYLYHPGYTERVHNRYVCRHCEKSGLYGKRYRVPSSFTYGDIVNHEIPMIIDFVTRHAEVRKLSWIGYSMGGMALYSYLAKNRKNPIKNVITIASPMSLNQVFIRLIPFFNFTSNSLGFEESKFMGTLGENLIPLTRIIRILPDWIVRFNLLAPILFNPKNIGNKTVKTLIGKIVEPIPMELERFFAKFISRGYSSQSKFTRYLDNLRRLRRTNKQFFFFYGSNDVIATPESVFLAREIISPHDPNNLIGVSIAGHTDLIVGNKAMETVWQPTVKWLKERED